MHDDTKEPIYVLEIRNAELIESLTQQAAEQGITYAAIVALIGAIERQIPRTPTGLRQILDTSERQMAVDTT